MPSPSYSIWCDQFTHRVSSNLAAFSEPHLAGCVAGCWTHGSSQCGFGASSEGEEGCLSGSSSLGRQFDDWSGSLVICSFFGGRRWKTTRLHKWSIIYIYTLQVQRFSKTRSFVKDQVLLDLFVRLKFSHLPTSLALTTCYNHLSPGKLGPWRFTVLSR